MEAVSAVEDPDMPWKNMAATTTAMPSPPRPRPTVISVTPISLCATPPSAMIVPAKMNSGMVRKGKELSELKTC